MADFLMNCWYIFITCWFFGGLYYLIRNEIRKKRAVENLNIKININSKESDLKGFENAEELNELCKEYGIPFRFEESKENNTQDDKPQPEPKHDTPEVKFIKSQRTMWLRMCYASFAFLIYALYNDYSYDIYLPIFGLAFFFIYKIIKLGMEHPETLEDNDLAKKYFLQKNKK